MRRKVARWVVLIFLLLAPGCGYPGLFYTLASLDIFQTVSAAQKEAAQEHRIAELEEQLEKDPNSSDPNKR